MTDEAPKKEAPKQEPKAKPGEKPAAPHDPAASVLSAHEQRMKAWFGQK